MLSFIRIHATSFSASALWGSGLVYLIFFGRLACEANSLMAALTWSFSAKTPPSPVPEGDEEAKNSVSVLRHGMTDSTCLEVSPIHGERQTGMALPQQHHSQANIMSDNGGTRPGSKICIKQNLATWRLGHDLLGCLVPPSSVQALSGESTDCNCSKTSASSSQGAANLFLCPV